jgi:hypothetical protein
MSFNDHDPIGRGARAVLDASRASELEEHSFCLLTETSLRLAYRGATTEVGPAPGRVALGVIDVRLSWSPEVAPPLVVRVVISDELARGAWRQASVAIGDAVRAALLERNQEKREGNAT